MRMIKSIVEPYYYANEDSGHKSKLNIWVVKLAFAFMLMPFFSLFPISTDVQPFFLLFIFMTFLFGRLFRLGSLEVFFLVVCIYSVFYRDFFSSSIGFRYLFGLPVAFVAFYFSRWKLDYLTNRLVFYVALTNFCFVLINFFFAEQFINLASNFVRVIKVVDVSGARGASGLAPEPGFTGAMCVVYIAIAFFNMRFNRDSRYVVSIFILCSVALFLTKSGTGYLLYVLFLLFFFMSANIRSFLCLILLCVVAYIFIDVIQFGRGASVLKGLIDDPMGLLARDRSVGIRFINILVGFLSVFNNPLGYGGEGFDDIFSHLVEEYRLLEVFAGAGGNVSAFSRYSVEAGLFFWGLLAWFFFLAVKRKRLAFLILGFSFISASFSIVFPPIWILMAMVCRK